MTVSALLRRYCRIAPVIAVLASAAAAGLVAAPIPEVDQPAVQMSPFEVSASSVEFQKWRKVSSRNFVLYTDGKAREADQVLRQMEMLHVMAQRYFRREALKRAPMVFVLPTSGSDWRKIESKSGVQWRVAISDPAHTIVDLIIAHYDWQQSLSLMFNEQGRAELRWLNLPEPLWFQRGIMGFFGAAQFKGDTVSLGHPSQKIAAVIHGGWLDWPAVFRVNFQSPEYIRTDLIQRLNGQCSAFVQYLLTHSDPVWVERLMEWVSITDAEPSPAHTEFTRVFQQDWKAWEKTMDAYLRSGKYTISTLRFPKGALEVKTTTHPLPVREMRELFVLVQILNQKVPASADALDKLLAKGLKSDALRELLVEACMAHNRADAALRELQTLIAAGSTNPEVYAAAATLAFNQRFSELTLASRMEEENGEILRWCEKAIALEPRHREANRILAWSAALGPRVEAAHVEIIKQTYRRLAGHSATTGPVAALAIASWRVGDRATADSLSKQLISSPYTDKEPRAMATALLMELNAVK